MLLFHFLKKFITSNLTEQNREKKNITEHFNCSFCTYRNHFLFCVWTFFRWGNSEIFPERIASFCRVRNYRVWHYFDSLYYTWKKTQEKKKIKTKTNLKFCYIFFGTVCMCFRSYFKMIYQKQNHNVIDSIDPFLYIRSKLILR